jgi:arylamine N-acetyltransferase
LAPPADSSVLRAFLEHFRLSPNAEPRQLLDAVAAGFAHLPYENLTKIIKQAELAGGAAARRQPHEVVADHARWGAGGTCFSLTATLLHLVRALGWRAEPILADRRYGENTHCALIVWIDDQPHLLDPGYLIVRPIPLGRAGQQRVTTAFNQVVLAPQTAADKVDLYTVAQGKQTYRLTFKTRPAEPGEFLKSWDDSFHWDMMRYPVLTRTCGPKQLYLQGGRLQVRTLAAVERREIPADELISRIETDFGVDASLAARALAILKRRGEPHG